MGRFTSRLHDIRRGPLQALLVEELTRQGPGPIPGLPGMGDPLIDPVGPGGFPGGPAGGLNIDVTLPGGIEFEIPGTGGISGTIPIGTNGGGGGGRFAPSDGGPCGFFQSPDPITGECRFDMDPGAGQGFPGGGAGGGGGLTRPAAVSRRVLECTRFADGKKGILWMNALTGDVVCLPRRTSGRGFGLIRKNKPRKKAYITAAEKASLTKITKIQGRAKKFATDAGFSCKKR